MAQTGDEAGSVLENLPGLTDFHQLQFYERRMAFARVVQLDADPSLAQGDFDFPHLQRIHRYILQDVYPSWAGQIRSEDTTAMGMAHCRPEFIPEQLRAVFGALQRQRPSMTDPDHAAATTANHWGGADSGPSVSGWEFAGSARFLHPVLARCELGYRLDGGECVGRPRGPPRSDGDGRFLIPGRAAAAGCCSGGHCSDWHIGSNARPAGRPHVGGAVPRNACPQACWTSGVGFPSCGRRWWTVGYR